MNEFSKEREFAIECCLEAERDLQELVEGGVFDKISTLEVPLQSQNFKGKLEAERYVIERGYVPITFKAGVDGEPVLKLLYKKPMCDKKGANLYLKAIMQYNNDVMLTSNDKDLLISHRSLILFANKHASATTLSMLLAVFGYIGLKKFHASDDIDSCVKFYKQLSTI